MLVLKSDFKKVQQFFSTRETCITFTL